MTTYRTSVTEFNYNWDFCNNSPKRTKYISVSSNTTTLADNRSDLRNLTEHALENLLADLLCYGIDFTICNKTYHTEIDHKSSAINARASDYAVSAKTSRIKNLLAVTISVISTIVLSLFIDSYWQYRNDLKQITMPTRSVQASEGPDQTKKMLASTTPRIQSQEHEVKEVFDTLRQANLNKNIDLFMSCYSSKFARLPEKKVSMLNNWKKYNYRTLSYDVTTLNSTDNTITAKVNWSISATDLKYNKTVPMSSKYKVALEKEDGYWKITQIKKI